MLKYQDLKEDFEYPDAKIVEWKDNEIVIKQYLPSEDKYGIIYVCLMSLDIKEQPYNPLLAEILFEVELVKQYSNIMFEEIEDSFFKQFDILDQLGLIELVIANIPQTEYEELQRLYYESIEANIKYNSNIANSINGLFNNFEQLQNIDTEELSKGFEVIQEFAKEQHI